MLCVTKKVLIISLIFFFSGICACAKDVVSGKSTLNYYSVGSDVKLGHYVMVAQIKALKKSKKELDSKNNTKQLKQIREIVKNISSVTHYPNFPYEVHLADIPVVNAWCAPGGKIMVYEGLWDPKKGLVKKGNADELAAVIAHEMAHANARHVTEAISRNLTVYSVGAVAASAISSASNIGGNIFSEIFTEGFNIFVPTYSRSNEKEADRLGLFYMAKSGYDPRAAVDVWTRAAKGKGDRTSIYATHPSSGERANELKKHLPEAMKYYEEALLVGKGDPKAARNLKRELRQRKANNIN